MAVTEIDPSLDPSQVSSETDQAMRERFGDEEPVLELVVDNTDTLTEEDQPTPEEHEENLGNLIVEAEQDLDPNDERGKQYYKDNREPGNKESFFSLDEATKLDIQEQAFKAELVGRLQAEKARQEEEQEQEIADRRENIVKDYQAKQAAGREKLKQYNEEVNARKAVEEAKDYKNALRTTGTIGSGKTTAAEANEEVAGKNYNSVHNKTNNGTKKSSYLDQKNTTVLTDTELNADSMSYDSSAETMNGTKKPSYLEREKEKPTTFEDVVKLNITEESEALGLTGKEAEDFNNAVWDEIAKAKEEIDAQDTSKFSPKQREELRSAGLERAIWDARVEQSLGDSETNMQAGEEAREQFSALLNVEESKPTAEELNHLAAGQQVIVDGFNREIDTLKTAFLSESNPTERGKLETQIHDLESGRDKARGELSRARMEKAQHEIDNSKSVSPEDTEVLKSIPNNEYAPENGEKETRKKPGRLKRLMGVIAVAGLSLIPSAYAQGESGQDAPPEVAAAEATVPEKAESNPNEVIHVDDTTLEAGDTVATEYGMQVADMFNIPEESKVAFSHDIGHQIETDNPDYDFNTMDGNYGEQFDLTRGQIEKIAKKYL